MRPTTPALALASLALLAGCAGEATTASTTTIRVTTPPASSDAISAAAHSLVASGTAPATNPVSAGTPAPPRPGAPVTGARSQVSSASSGDQAAQLGPGGTPVAGETVGPTSGDAVVGGDASAQGAGPAAPGRSAGDSPAPQRAGEGFGQVQAPGLEVASAQDASRLPDAPGLQAFAQQQLARLDVEEPDCPHTITVDRIDPRTSAFVGEFGSGCGGGAAIWGTKDGRWVHVWSGQGVPTCSELRDTGATLNPQVVGQCMEGSGTRPYTP